MQIVQIFVVRTIFDAQQLLVKLEKPTVNIFRSSVEKKNCPALTKLYKKK